MKRFFLSLMVGAFALPLVMSAGTASADVLDQNKVGSALALLYLTDNEGTRDEVTSAIVTNTSNDEIVLAIQLISGDDGGDWDGQSFRCPMTPGETTQFFFFPDPNEANQTRVKYECSTPGADPLDLDPGPKSIQKDPLIDSARGIMWVTAEDTSGNTRNHNFLEGKSVIINFEDGHAVELGAVPFQGPDPLKQDFDKKYEFDGMEYASFPEALTASFHAPDGNNIETELILFTLDGRLSSQATPNAEAVVHFFNDDEEFFNDSLNFDCFAIIDLEDISSTFKRQNLGSQVGHIEIIPQSVDPNDENHDGQFGDDDNARFVGILGWIVTEFNDNAEINDSAGDPHGTIPNSESALIGSLLTTSMNALPNESNDVPALQP